jgi:hypothetical protein
MKCIHNFCGEEMHEGWWLSVGIIKLGSTPKIEVENQATTKKMWQSHALLGKCINLNVNLALLLTNHVTSYI